MSGTPTKLVFEAQEFRTQENGRAGAFIVEERGTFAGRGEVRCTFEVVAGTGELTELRGTGRYVAVHGEPSVAYVFEYTLP